MKTTAISEKYSINLEDFENFLKEKKLQYKESSFTMNITVDDSNVENYVAMYHEYVEQRQIDEENARQEEQRKQKAMAEMLISSGFSFEGYRIVKYSGYISGDDVIQIAKEKSLWTGMSKIDVGQSLSDSLVKIRRQALKELKEAAYALGCNAVIGVDFDYITLDPQFHSGEITQDLPFVFCVTANGNAVVIEKE